jgi:hypothetical protein
LLRAPARVVEENPTLGSPPDALFDAEAEWFSKAIVEVEIIRSCRRD